jgi:hypothetical protein
MNGLTARPTVTLAYASKSSGNLRFMQEFDRRLDTHMYRLAVIVYGLAVIIAASFGWLDSLEAHSEAWRRRTKHDDRRSPNDRITHGKD